MSSLSGRTVRPGGQDEAVQYRSIYSYQKLRYPVFDDESNMLLGYVKQECILDEDGEWLAPVYYTKDFSRPSGKTRFYGSVNSLLIAFGAKIARVAKKKLTSAKKSPPRVVKLTA
jgi:hypothetical protein